MAALVDEVADMVPDALMISDALACIVAGGVALDDDGALAGGLAGGLGGVS